MLAFTWIVLLLVAGLVVWVPGIGPALAGSALLLGVVITLYRPARPAVSSTEVMQMAPGVEAERAPASELTVDTAGPRIKKRTIEVDGLDVVDLTGLGETVRSRIVGSAFYLTDADRKRHGGPWYLLVLEPDNAADRLAIAVYGPRGRQVGYLSAKRAALMHRHLVRLGAGAYRVLGKGVTENSVVLHVDLPRIPELRDFARQ